MIKGAGLVPAFFLQRGAGAAAFIRTYPELYDQAASLVRNTVKSSRIRRKELHQAPLRHRQQRFLQRKFQHRFHHIHRRVG